MSREAKIAEKIRNSILATGGTKVADDLYPLDEEKRAARNVLRILATKLAKGMTFGRQDMETLDETETTLTGLGMRGEAWELHKIRDELYRLLREEDAVLIQKQAIDAKIYALREEFQNNARLLTKLATSVR